RNHEVRLVVLDQRGEAVPNQLAAGPANHVANEQYPHPWIMNHNADKVILGSRCRLSARGSRLSALGSRLRLSATSELHLPGSRTIPTAEVESPRIERRELPARRKPRAE